MIDPTNQSSPVLVVIRASKKTTAAIPATVLIAARNRCFVIGTMFAHDGEN